jgi:quinol monooxygenase YgiN
MSSVSLIIAGLGAVAAAIGSGVLLARCFRGPRTDLVAWSIALIGLLISLGSQALGYLVGFDGAMFRAMELGAQVIAPLALILALSEVASRSLAARFCARVYIPAVAIVALVVLTLDQLAAVTFTKAWPNPAVFYEAPPKYVLMFAIGPLTALITLIAVGVVLRRSGRPGWDAARPAQLAAGLAALLLAYPALVLLVNFAAGVNLPVRSEFSALCAVAAGLIWFAGVRTGQLRIGALHGRGVSSAGADGNGAAAGWGGDDGWSHDDSSGWDGAGLRRDSARQRDLDRAGVADDWDDYGRPHELDQTGDFDRHGVGSDQDMYRGGGLYRPEQAADGARVPVPDHDGDEYDYGWQTSNDRYAGRGAPGDGSDGPDGGFATGDYDLGPGAAGYAAAASSEHSRADLFGQIAIYTLLEDRVNEFDQLTERVVEKVRSRESDTLVFIVHAVPSAPMQRILYEVYRDREAYERHRQQPYVAQFETDRRPYVLATNVIELGLQQGKVSPFPSVSELFAEPGYDTSGFERPDYLRDYGKPAAGQDGSSRSW